MSEFWWGVLALPLIALAVAASAGAVFGAWLLVEKWFEMRWLKLKPVELPEAIGRGEMQLWSAGDLGVRGSFSSVMLSGGKVRGIRIGTGAIFFAWGKHDTKKARTIQTALRNALYEVVKEETEVAAAVKEEQ